MSYRGLKGEAFIDYLLDQGGLVEFIDAQMKGLPERLPEHWADCTQRIGYLSDRYWLPTPEYVEGLYHMQVERASRATDKAAAA